MDFKIVLEVFEFSCMGLPGESEAFLNRETGEYFIVSDYCDSEQLPDDLETEKYVVLPSKSALKLGKRLVLRFASLYLEEDYDNVQLIFRRKGAYSKFKSLLERRSLIDKWHEFEAQAQERALREWCQDVGVELNG
jgi:hypothetical protein